MEALAVYDGELYAAGLFTQVGSISANHIARWDGTEWAGMGQGRNNVVFALQVWNPPGPTPESLFIGGQFTAAA